MGIEEPLLSIARAKDSAIARQIDDKGIDGVVGAFESSILQRYWVKHAGNRKLIAEKLGITVRSLRYRLAKYSIGPALDEDAEPPSQDDIVE
jgi:two-component system response regulator PilR (NtrC family)